MGKKRTKKILISAVTAGSRGFTVAVSTKIKYFVDHGFALDVICGNLIYPVTKAEIVNIYQFNQNFRRNSHFQETDLSKYQFIWFALVRNLKSTLLIPRLLNRHYDFVYSPSSVLDLVILPFFLKQFQPKIKWITVFDKPEKLNRPGPLLIRLLSNLFFRLSLPLIRQTDFISVSAYVIEFLRQNKFPEGKIEFTGSGIEKDLIRRARKKQKYSIDAVYVGRIDPVKGIFDLLKVVSSVKTTYPKFKLAVIGSGDRKTLSEFNQKIEEAGLAQNVIQFGTVVGLKKFKLLSSARCFIHLSYEESFCLSLMEAVCMGKPSFAYAIDPLISMYPRGEVYFSRLGDYKNVVSNVLSLFGRGKFDNKRGRKLLQDQITWEQVAAHEVRRIGQLVTN